MKKASTAAPITLVKKAKKVRILDPSQIVLDVIEKRTKIFLRDKTLVELAIVEENNGVGSSYRRKNMPPSMYWTITKADMTGSGIRGKLWGVFSLNNKLKFEGKEMLIRGANKRGVWQPVSHDFKLNLKYNLEEAAMKHRILNLARKQNKEFARKE